MAIADESFYNILGEEISRENILEQMINFYALKLEVGESKVTDFNEGSEIRNLLEAYAVISYWMMDEKNEATKIAFIETAEGEYLDMHGAKPNINLPRDLGSEATGFVTFSIPEAISEEIIIPENTTVVCEETGMEYYTQNEAIIPVGETNVVAAVECATEGVEGNCSMGAINLIDDEILNIPELVVTNENEIAGGTDYEEDEEYSKRLLNHVRNNDFGSVPYYLDLGNNVDGVHDIALVDSDNPDIDYTQKVLVNGNVKPTPNTVLLDVAEEFTNLNNVILKQTFEIAKPNYVDVSITLNLEVSEEISEEALSNIAYAIFDGGSPELGFEFEGLGIGETLFARSLYSTFELYANVESVQIIDDTTEQDLQDLNVDDDEVLKLSSLTINQTIVN